MREDLQHVLQPDRSGFLLAGEPILDADEVYIITAVRQTDARIRVASKLVQYQLHRGVVNLGEY
jgi:hypothetical protein